MSHIDTLGSSGSSHPSGLSRRADSAVPSGSTDRLSVGSDLGRPGARSESTALRSLSDRELLSRVKDLVARERAVTLEVLVHLIEVERRRLHLGLGYASMFDYCTRHLGYSSSSAARRIHTARCLRDYPEVRGLLERNEVNISTVSLVASILTGENRADLLGRIRNKSQKEVEAIVADYKPPVSLRDRARPVCVAVAAAAVAGALESSSTASSVPGAPGSPSSEAPDTASSGEDRQSLFSATGSEDGCAAYPTQRTSGSGYSRCGSEKRPNGAADGVGGPPRIERKFQVQFLASERFMKKFERARALLSNKSGSFSYEAVLEAALDEYLKDHDPEKRNKRREERKQKAEASNKSKDRAAIKPSGSRAKGGNCSAGSVRADEETSRRIPAAVRDAVFARDKGRCTFMGSNGERCASTHHLQIDHVVPFARGGTNALGNLRLLCERHNKKEAERVLGPNLTGKFRERE